MQRLRTAVPSGLTVMADLYKDHVIFAALIAGALAAGTYLIPLVATF